MPRRDKTGPEGKGPRTGRGLGVCNTPKTEDLLQADDVALTTSEKVIKKILG